MNLGLSQASFISLALVGGSKKVAQEIARPSGVNACFGHKKHKEQVEITCRHVFTKMHGKPNESLGTAPWPTELPQGGDVINQAPLGLEGVLHLEPLMDRPRQPMATYGNLLGYWT